MTGALDVAVRIEELRRIGVPDSVIAGRLLLEGYSQADITLHLRGSMAPVVSGAPDASSAIRQPVLDMAPLRAAPPTAARPQRSRFSPALFMFLFAVGALGSSAYMYMRPPVVYSISVPTPESTSTVATLRYGALPALSDPEYYERTRERLIESGASFIDANLSSMRLSVYQEGVQTLEVPILAKGRVGSWWETPAGIYKIQTKEKTHRSSFGGVDMPWSMAFQGNFFIHGWPTHEDGTPVSSTYSGGCIRLSTEDAGAVFVRSQIGMPVIVYNEPLATDAFSYELKAPRVSASGYLVADVKNGTVLASRAARERAPIASITKLVTALVTTEHLNLDKEITVPPEAIVFTSVPRLKPGQEFRPYDLLHILLTESSNEAAETLAAAKGSGAFVRAMNEKVAAIGLAQTSFNDASGAEDDFSTPEDLFALLRYVYASRRFVCNMTTGTLKDSAYGDPAFKNILNFNPIKNVPATLVCGKIGQTNEAGETYAGIFSVRIGQELRDIAVIALGSSDVERDVRALLSFVSGAYQGTDRPSPVSRP